MTYKTHTQNISDPGFVSKDGITTGNMHAILLMLEERILMGCEEDAELALRFASPHASFGKTLRDSRIHNFRMWQSLEASQEKNKHEPDNTPSPEDDAAARADLADVLFKLQHAAVNAMAVEPSNQEDETFTF